MADVTSENGRVTGVTTASGQHIKAEYVVNCAGMWARQMGELSGVNVPNQAARQSLIINQNAAAAGFQMHITPLGTFGAASIFRGGGARLESSINNV